MGPTGAGKTDLALELAERLAAEIVSVDSAMVYRGLDIGTAKPPRDVRERIPHHLVDVLDPAESYSAGRFLHELAIPERLPGHSADQEESMDMAFGQADTLRLGLYRCSP